MMTAKREKGVSTSMDTNPTWWRRQRAKEIAREKADERLQRVLRAEPKAWEVLTMAREQKFSLTYHQDHEYVHLKHRAMRLVGWGARNPLLRSHEYYDAMIYAISCLLPPDVSELRFTGDITDDEAEQLYRSDDDDDAIYDYGYVPLSDDEIERWLNTPPKTRQAKGA